MVDPMFLEYTYNTYIHIYIYKLIISPRLCMYVYIYILSGLYIYNIYIINQL